MKSYFILVMLFLANSLFAQMGDCDNNPVIFKDLEINFDEKLSGALNPGGINATSYMSDKKEPLKYHLIKAFDGNPATAWVEGTKGNGVGEKIALSIPENTKSIEILPGLGIAKYFSMNNRVHTAKLVVYTIKESFASQCYTTMFLGKVLYEKELTFTDKMTMQKFLLNLSNKETAIAVLTITSVYKGSKWNDTCISEIVIK